MKPLICAINTKYVHSSLAPWYLKASVAEKYPDIECEVLEFTINESEEELLEKILSSDAELIAFSTYIWNVKLVLSLSEKIKKRRSVKIALGGPEVSYNAYEVLRKNPFVDFVLCGEGEKPFAELCGDNSPKNIDGLCYRNGDETVIKPPFVSDEEPPCPYTDEYLKRLNGRIAYLETSRGCPYRCAFCLSGRCGGVKFFNIERSKKDIVILANSGAKTVKLVDRTFNADKRRAKELFAFIINNYTTLIPDNVCFHFEIEGDILDDETIALLSRARPGSIQMEIGLQSFNRKTLDSINRKTNLQKLCRNTKKLLSLKNIHIHIDLIAGLPFEDLQSFENSFNKALELEPHMLQLGFLKLLHGSDLKENKELYPCEYSSEPPYEIKSTPWLSNGDLKALHRIEDVFERMYNSGRFSRTCQYIHSLFKSPFQAYKGLADFVAENEKSRALDELTKLIYDYFAKFEFVDSDKLRDLMAIDRLASNRMGTLPEFLKNHTPKTKEYLSALELSPQTRKQRGIKRALTVLKSENAFVYVDYDCKNAVTNQYRVIKYII